MSPIFALYPCLALVALTAVVWLMLFTDRVREMRQRKIRPQTIASAQQAAEVLKNTNAADNFKNLLELPVLFYVLCLAEYSTQIFDAKLLAGAWLFVAFRVLHSFVHCTYNRVMHRFYVYFIGSVVLFGLWGAFAVKLIGRLP